MELDDEAVSGNVCLVNTGTAGFTTGCGLRLHLGEDEEEYDEEEDELFESLYIKINESSDDDITRGGDEEDLFSDDDSGLAAGAEEDVEEDIDEDEEVSVDDMEDLYDQYEDDDGSLISP